jgi:hypothetical protein
MNYRKNHKRILALDVRPRSFGFVVFEGPDKLLDWGVRSFRKGVNAVRIPLAKKIDVLLDECDPAAVVAKEGPRRIKLNSGKRRRMLDEVLRKAERRGISVRVLRPSAVRKTLAENGNLTKHEMASAMAKRFPELAPVLPPKRKCYESEDYRMSIFDAAALGVAYFSRSKSVEPGELAPLPAPSRHS